MRQLAHEQMLCGLVEPIVPAGQLHVIGPSVGVRETGEALRMLGILIMQFAQLSTCGLPSELAGQQIPTSIPIVLKDDSRAGSGASPPGKHALALELGHNPLGSSLRTAEAFDQRGHVLPGVFFGELEGPA